MIASVKGTHNANPKKSETTSESRSHIKKYISLFSRLVSVCRVASRFAVAPPFEDAF